MSAKVRQCNSWLNALNISVPQDWVEACVQWIDENNGNSNLNQRTLHHKVYQQWLVTNLSDFDTPVIPQDINDEKYILKKSMCLQVDSVIDVSQPAYAQLLNLRGGENPNTLVSAETQSTYRRPTQNEDKKSRMLRLTLTDGVNTISGVEFRPIPTLSVNILPGTKVRLKAPITCRRRCMMLKPSLVEVLGGEVEELLFSNSYESILCQALGIPFIASNRAPNTNSQQPEVISNEDIPMELLDELMTDDFDDNTVAKQAVITPQQAVRNTNVKIPAPQTRMDVKTTLLKAPIAPQQAAENTYVKRPVAQQTSLVDLTNKGRNIKQEIVRNNNHKTTYMNDYVDCIMDDDDDFEMEILSNKESQITEQVTSSNSDTICKKFLCQIKESEMINMQKIKFCTKAVIITLCSKLQHDSVDGWSIKVKLCDGTKTVNAQFCNQVILKLMKAENTLDMNSLCRDQHQLCKDELITMCSFMDIEVMKENGVVKYSVLDLK